ncbi:hypothetical protein [Methylobacterium sp. JK268]
MRDDTIQSADRTLFSIVGIVLPTHRAPRRPAPAKKAAADKAASQPKCGDAGA